MLKGKITKIIFVLACIVTLVMPYTSSVLAVKLKETDTKVNLISWEFVFTTFSLLSSSILLL